MFLRFLSSPVYNTIVRYTQYERSFINEKEKVNDEESQNDYCIDYESEDNNYLIYAKSCINYTAILFIVFIILITNYILYLIYLKDIV
jgi:hypothetical protein